jgi:hypothetical protein
VDVAVKVVIGFPLRDYQFVQESEASRQPHKRHQPSSLSEDCTARATVIAAYSPNNVTSMVRRRKSLRKGVRLAYASFGANARPEEAQASAAAECRQTGGKQSIKALIDGEQIFGNTLGSERTQARTNSVRLVVRLFFDWIIFRSRSAQNSRAHHRR